MGSFAQATPLARIAVTIWDTHVLYPRRRQHSGRCIVVATKWYCPHSWATCSMESCSKCDIIYLHWQLSFKGNYGWVQVLPILWKFAKVNNPGVKFVNGLWYIRSCLLIPRVGNVWEQLFCLSHDTLGHFGTNKSYMTLRDAYYWLNMRWDLEKAYVLSCVHCQRNKSSTTKLPGPLHPLPVPDKHGQSITMDFVGPLKEDLGFNCILFITDQLGAEIRIVPTRMDISTENLAVLFFNHWYCENGLPLDIISNHNKLFISRFWKTLTELCGVKLKCKQPITLKLMYLVNIPTKWSTNPYVSMSIANKKVGFTHYPEFILWSWTLWMCQLDSSISNSIWDTCLMLFPP